RVRSLCPTATGAEYHLADDASNGRQRGCGSTGSPDFVRGCARDGLVVTGHLGGECGAVGTREATCFLGRAGRLWGLASGESSCLLRLRYAVVCLDFQDPA